MPWKNFTKDEFACRCGCGSNQIRDEIIDAVQKIRTEVGYPLVVSSGYRCSEHPVEKSKTKPGTGTHCRGVAADLAVSHQQAKEVLVVALQMDVGGVGVHQKGDGRFIHIDVDIDRRSLIWTY
jgi:zinc D-Ala-D-Ala carboxypeptidase|tara:strand:- start:617 stop:985 length:369 start_codon:yes stop_codon:yes gene_type:complete